MRIVHVAYPLAAVGPDAVGGAEQVLAALDAAAIAAGHESIVVALEGSRCAGRLLPIPRPAGAYDEGARDRARGSIRSALAHIVASGSPDVVHFHGVDFHEYLPPPGPVALVTLHLPLAWYPAHALRPFRARTFLHCVSASQHREFAGAAELLPPMPNGVSLQQLGPRRRRGGFALALGRISPEKGFHVALAAAREARMPLVVAGEVFPYPEHRAYFEREILPLLDGQRRFVGPIGLSRKRRLLAAARCVVVPSLASESSSLVAMEALASGTPVVAFPSGALAEIVEHGRTGFLVRTVPDMARAMRSATSLRSEDCRAAAEQRFDAARMATRYLELYRRLTTAIATPSTSTATPTVPATATPPRRILVDLATPSQLADLVPAWRDLWERCRTATPFQRPEWLVPWYRSLSFGGGVALTAWRGGELVGLAALHCFDDRGRRAIGLAGGPVSDYRDALADDALRDEVAAALVERLARADLAEVAILDDLPEGAVLLGAGAEPAQACPVLPLDGGLDAVRSRFSPRLARNLAYERRRLARECDVRFELADAGRLPEYRDALFRLHRARWERAGRPGVLADPAVETFHRLAWPLLESAGLQRVHALRVDGRVAAACHVLQARGKAYLYLTGYDPGVGRRSPGKLLCERAIEAAVEEGARSFDFLRGREPYKHEFGAADRTTWRRHLATGEAGDAAVCGLRAIHTV